MLAFDEAASTPDLVQVAVLAVLQGLTEFLPVSSSGHHVLGEHLLGLESGGLTLPVALHLGTLLAVLAVYRRAVAALFADLFAGRLRAVLMILLGSVPAGLAGVFLDDWFEARFAEPRTAGYGLLVTAVVLLIADLARSRASGTQEAAREPGIRDALLIGLAQACAILPGISRSGSTIGTGLLCGLRPDVAARFSFMLSLVAVGGASLLEARDVFDAPASEATPWGLLLVGVALAAVTGWFALRLLLAFLERGAFRWFALYCSLVGVSVLLFL